MKYERIEQLRHQYPTAVLCRVIDVSESGYHAPGVNARQRLASRNLSGWKAKSVQHIRGRGLLTSTASR